MFPNKLSFWEKERERNLYVQNKILKKDWLCLPPEYEKDPEGTLKFLKSSLEVIEQKIKVERWKNGDEQQS